MCGRQADQPPEFLPDHGSGLKRGKRLILLAHVGDPLSLGFLTINGERCDDSSSSRSLRLANLILNWAGCLQGSQGTLRLRDFRLFSFVLSDRCHVPTVRAFTPDGHELNCHLHDSVAALLNRDNHRDSGYRHPEDVTILRPPCLGRRKLGHLHFNAASFAHARKASARICSEAWQIVRRKDTGSGHYAEISEIQGAVIRREGLVIVEDQVISVDQQAMQETTRLGLFPLGREYYVVRRLPRDQVFLDSGIYLGTHLDFLFYEALIYGLPKLVAALQHIAESRATVLVNAYMHPNVEHLFRRILSAHGSPMNIVKVSRSVETHVKRLSIMKAKPDHRVSAAEERWNLASVAQDVLQLLGLESLHARSQGDESRVWIRRKHQARDLQDRVPLNINVIEDIVQRHGFVLVDPGLLSMEEQIELFARADIIAGLHGGALANLIWCRPGTRVLEIFTSWIDPCFEQLCADLRLDYRAIKCELIAPGFDALTSIGRILGLTKERGRYSSLVDEALMEHALRQIEEEAVHARAC